MRISDWSSDVCSSDLHRRLARAGPAGGRSALAAQFGGELLDPVAQVGQVVAAGDAELGQGALDAVLEHLLQAVPGVGGAFARLVDAVLDHVAHGVAAVVGELARGLLQVQADRKSTRLNSSH